jgi:hypothetical protein
MKNIVYLFLVLVLLSLTFTGCTGVNGNPLELLGKWKHSYNSNGDPGSDSETDIYIFNNDGTFTLTEEVTNTGKDTVITYKGKYYGNPADTPKDITWEITSNSKTILGVNQSAPNLVEGTQNGNYYIIYSTPNMLSINGFNSGLYTKQ